MLVGHYPIETNFVHQGVLLVVLVVENVRFFRVEVGVREQETGRVVPV